MTDDEPRPKKRIKAPSPWRIEINRPRCTGVGTCVDLAPRTFDLDDDAVAIVRDPDGDAGEKQRAAAEACPRDAILLFLKETGEKVWPQ